MGTTLLWLLTYMCSMSLRVPVKYTLTGVQIKQARLLLSQCLLKQNFQGLEESFMTPGIK